MSIERAEEQTFPPHSWRQVHLYARKTPKSKLQRARQKRIKWNNKILLTKQGESATFLSALEMHNERGMLLKAAALV